MRITASPTAAHWTPREDIIHLEDDRPSIAAYAQSRFTYTGRIEPVSQPEWKYNWGFCLTCLRHGVSE